MFHEVFNHQFCTTKGMCITSAAETFCSSQIHRKIYWIMEMKYGKIHQF